MDNEKIIVKKFFDDNWQTGWDTGHPSCSGWYLVTDCNIKEIVEISCAMARYDVSQDVWYNENGVPLTYYDFGDSNNNCSYVEGKVTHFMDNSDMSHFIVKYLTRNKGKYHGGQSIFKK